MTPLNQPDLPALEQSCQQCNGSGVREGQFTDCPNCDGTGKIATDFGECVLELLEHNFKRLAKEHLQLKAV